MTDDSDSGEEFVVSCLLFAAASQCTSEVCKCRVRLVWTQSWIADRPRFKGWEFIRSCYMSCKQLKSSYFTQVTSDVILRRNIF